MVKIVPRKRWGQHWLKDESVLAAIVAAARLTPTDRVLEIGPGTGNLTQKLLSSGCALTAIEFDRDLCLYLNQTIHHPSFQLIEGDVLRWEIPPTIDKIVANIPYNITGEILKKVLGTLSHPVNQFQTIVLLVQKEIAERLTASPGHRAFGALTVRTQYLSDCEWMLDVRARCFQPPPKVDSAVVRLTPRSPLVAASHPRFLETIVKLGFSQKRKMLRNNLQTIGGREPITQILAAMDIHPDVRAENLTVSQWVALSEQLLSLQGEAVPVL